MEIPWKWIVITILLITVIVMAVMLLVRSTEMNLLNTTPSVNDVPERYTGGMPEYPPVSADGSEHPPPPELPLPPQRAPHINEPRHILPKAQDPFYVQFPEAQGWLSIESLRHKHNEETLFILGTNSELEQFPPHFFHDSITIGINQVYVRHPVTYLVRKDISLLPQTLQFLQEQQCHTKVVVAEFDQGDHTNTRVTQMESPQQSLYVFQHPHVQPNRIDTEAISQQAPHTLIASEHTIISAMHLACIMGARHIVLVATTTQDVMAKHQIQLVAESLMETYQVCVTRLAPTKPPVTDRDLIVTS